MLGGLRGLCGDHWLSSKQAETTKSTEDAKSGRFPSFVVFVHFVVILRLRFEGRKISEGLWWYSSWRAPQPLR